MEAAVVWKLLKAKFESNLKEGRPDFEEPKGCEEA